MDIAELWDQVGRVVLLRFADGEEVEVRLLATDPQVHADLTYEVLRIHRRGEPSAPGSEIGAVVVASTDALVDWQPILE